MSAAIYKFPKVRRLVDPSARVPPLWQMVLLLQRALERHPHAFDNLDRGILHAANAIALEGEDAPIDRQIDYLRYCMNLLAKHCALLPAPVYLEPPTGAETAKARYEPESPHAR